MPSTCHAFSIYSRNACVYINMYMELCTQVFAVIHGIFHYMYSNGARVMNFEAGRALEKLESCSAPRGRCGDPRERQGGGRGAWPPGGSGKDELQAASLGPGRGCKRP